MKKMAKRMGERRKKSITVNDIAYKQHVGKYRMSNIWLNSGYLIICDISGNGEE